MEHELTIEQFFGCLAGSLIIIAPYRTEVERVSEYLLEKGNITFIVRNGTLILRPKHYFQVFFQASQTYLHFSPEETYTLIDLSELISYALQGESDMIFVKYLVL